VKRTRKVIVAAVAAATVALASVAVSGISAGAQTSVRGVTSTEIKVSGLGYATFYDSGGLAAKARFDEANKSGEIPGGRKINYIGFADDKSTADVNLSEGRRLVDQEQVFGVVPVITPFLQAGTYFNQQKVPTVGWGISPAFCDSANKYVFGFTGCLVPNPPTYPGNTWGELVNAQLTAQGKGGAKGKTAAVIAENNDSGKSGVEVISATAEAVGMKLVYNQASMPAPPTQITDFSPYVQALMTSNGGQPPDVIFLVISQGNVVSMGRALNQAGYKGLQTNAVSYAPQLTTLATGWSAFTQFATPESTSQNMAKITASLKAAGIDSIGQPALAGYFAADMFVQILKKAGKNLSPESFQKAAAKIQYSIPDVIGPTVYPASFKAGAPCVQLATSDGTKWAVTAPFKCYDLLTKKGNKWVQVPYPKGVK